MALEQKYQPGLGNIVSLIWMHLMRCASLDTAIPMNKILEEDFLAKARLAETIDKLLKY